INSPASSITVSMALGIVGRPLQLLSTMNAVQYNLSNLRERCLQWGWLPIVWVMLQLALRMLMDYKPTTTAPLTRQFLSAASFPVKIHLQDIPPRSCQTIA